MQECVARERGNVTYFRFWFFVSLSFGRALDIQARVFVARWPFTGLFKGQHGSIDGYIASLSDTRQPSGSLAAPRLLLFKSPRTCSTASSVVCTGAAYELFCSFNLTFSSHCYACSDR